MGDFRKQELLSVGVDIGTSTTQLVFSNIMIENLASSFNIARIEIVDKEIIYRSKIYFTPLIDNNHIDMERVIQIVDTEFASAGINRKDVDIGAVIVTGETARRDNANEVLQKMSGYAGDFVVATAGPELESIISGKGAGADRPSKEENIVVANIDIGGGTSNIAVFDRGQAVSAGCIDIGGRLVKFDTEGKVIYINNKIEQIIQKEVIPIRIGSKPTELALRTLAKIMVHELEILAGLAPKDDYYDLLITQKEMHYKSKVDALMFSGGVADIYYNHADEKDIYKYGDIGIILAQEMKNSKIFNSVRIDRPIETIRATVVGAGSHTSNISGSTITYDGELLPMKNIPVIKIPEVAEKNLATLSEEIRKRLDWFKLEGELQNVAFAMRGINSPSFKQVEEYAKAILEGAESICKENRPLLLLVEADMAKALGYTVRRLLKYKSKLICVDSIEVEDGDYVDFGNPIAGGMVLPVVVKTLIFK